MNPAIRDLLESIRSKKRHLYLIGGNINDEISISPKIPPSRGILALLLALTEKAFPHFVTYDPFNGMRALRGSLPKEPETQNEGNDPLMRALASAGGNAGAPDSPQAACRAIGGMLADPRREMTFVVLNFADSYLSPSEAGGPDLGKLLRIPLHEWSRDEEMHGRGHVIAVIDTNAHAIDEHVVDRTGCVETIRLPMPNEKERVAFLASLGWKDDQTSEIAWCSSGLSLGEIRRILSESGAKTPAKAVGALLDAKRGILMARYNGLLEVLPAKHDFDAIGGLGKVKAKLTAIAKAMRSGRRSLVPQGALFMGPPGTGKTVMAEAMAKEAGVNLIRPLDIKNMFVGQSERRMTAFLDALRDMAPVIVFIDEFDQNQSQRGGFDGDSGTSRTLMKKLLEAMSDTSQRGRILWLMATNRPDLIDSAMKRPGRCDLRIPFLPPDAEQLAAIFAAAFVQEPEMHTRIRDWSEWAQKCLGYNGADIIEVTRRAWEHASDDDRASIERQDMEWAHDDYVPQQADEAEVARMTYLAILECSSKRLLPANWKAVAAQSIERFGGMPTLGSDAASAPTKIGKVHAS